MTTNQIITKLLKTAKNPLPESKKTINFLILTIKSKIYEALKIKSFFKVYEGHDKLLDCLKQKKGGFFVECGGNNGKSYDPTYYLEKIMEWEGIIIEPLPVYKQCAKIRKKSEIYNCALVADDFPEKTISIMNCKMMSIIKGEEGYERWIKNGEKVQNIKAEELVVAADTLNNVLENYFLTHKMRNINLLVIDVECSEINVLKGFDLNKYKPEKILIEIQDQYKKNFVDSYLKSNYKLISRIGYNDYLYELNT